MKNLIILLLVLFASCGVRKVDKNKQLQTNSLVTTSSNIKEVDATSDEKKLKQIDYNVATSRQSFSDEQTELTADSIDYNVKTGNLKAKGNVKLKQKKQSTQRDSLSDKSKELQSKQKTVNNKAKEVKKETLEQKSKDESSTKNTKRNNTAATVLSIAVVIIGLMIFLRCKKLL